MSTVSYFLNNRAAGFSFSGSTVFFIAQVRCSDRLRTHICQESAARGELLVVSIHCSSTVRMPSQVMSEIVRILCFIDLQHAKHAFSTAKCDACAELQPGGYGIGRVFIVRFQAHAIDLSHKYDRRQPIRTSNCNKAPLLVGSLGTYIVFGPNGQSHSPLGSFYFGPCESSSWAVLATSLEKPNTKSGNATAIQTSWIT